MGGRRRGLPLGLRRLDGELYARCGGKEYNGPMASTADGVILKIDFKVQLVCSKVPGSTALPVSDSFHPVRSHHPSLQDPESAIISSSSYTSLHAIGSHALVLGSFCNFKSRTYPASSLHSKPSHLSCPLLEIVSAGTSHHKHPTASQSPLKLQNRRSGSSAS